MATKKITTYRKPTQPKVEAPKEKNICFIIMPFGGYRDNYFEQVYKPAIVDAGLEPKRADDLNTPGVITNDIWNFTKNAKMILAELTGQRANVFYELGLAHALAKPAILISETMDDVPFDLRALRVILYDKNEPDWGSLLKNKIVKAIKETLKTPLKSVLPAFLDIKEEEKSKPVSKHDKEIAEIKQQLAALQMRSNFYDIKASGYKQITPNNISEKELRKSIMALNEILKKSR